MALTVVGYTWTSVPLPKEAEDVLGRGIRDFYIGDLIQVGDLTGDPISMSLAVRAAQAKASLWRVVYINFTRSDTPAGGQRYVGASLLWDVNQLPLNFTLDEHAQNYAAGGFGAFYYGMTWPPLLRPTGEMRVRGLDSNTNGVTYQLRVAMYRYEISKPSLTSLLSTDKGP